MALSAAASGLMSAAAAAPPSGVSVTGGTTQIAQNFQSFLQLLTTQLKNQNPLEPLDTNQFTQQLVQFAQVEQQINMNSSLTTLVGLQKSADTTAAASFLGATVQIEGDTAQLKGGNATWTYSAPKAASAVINVQNAAGEVVYTENKTLTAGTQSFTWNGRTTAGSVAPEGSYKISVVGKDASGNSVGISTEVEGVVEAVDLTHSPPLLTINNASFPLDKIKQLRRSAT